MLGEGFKGELYTREGRGVLRGCLIRGSCTGERKRCYCSVLRDAGTLCVGEEAVRMRERLLENCFKGLLYY